MEARRPALLGIVTPDELAAQEQAAQERAAALGMPEPAITNLASHIRSKFAEFKNHRNSANGWSDKLLSALRMFKGEYPPEKLAHIRRFGGSDVYAKLVAGKCRGATSMLREVYLENERPWGLEPTPDPKLPNDMAAAVVSLVQSETAAMQSVGMPVSDEMILNRINTLMDAANQAARKKAKKKADDASRKLDDILVEGGFYGALAEALVDLPLFPFCVVKGPVVRIVSDLRWVDGVARNVSAPRMFWDRISPFDLWWTPGASDVTKAEIIERIRLTRADLNAVIGLPGYNESAVRAVLVEYGSGGLYEWLDGVDTERALQEHRESPALNTSGIIDALEYHGMIQGRALLEYGFDVARVPDPDRDYAVQAWLIGRHVIKVQMTPSPRQRHPYFITSFSKVPGTIVGDALPDVLDDVQDVANACLRALVNNLSISSGPQVVVNVDRLAPGEDPDDLYPWKRWKVEDGPQSNTAVPPISFFQPGSNAQQLLVVYEKMTQIADEISAIPRYVSGSDRMGGAGRTASGLSMLMGNAAKILKTVAYNIDNDIMKPALVALFDMIMLADGGRTLNGDENIVVRGVSVAMQRETERQRAIEVLNATNNPVDLQIVGLPGRAKLLRRVTNTIGFDGDDIVPDPDAVAAQAQQMQQMQQMTAAGAGDGAPGAGTPAAPAEAPQGPRENLFQQTEQP